MLGHCAGARLCGRRHSTVVPEAELRRAEAWSEDLHTIGAVTYVLILCIITARNFYNEPLLFRLHFGDVSA